MRATVGLTGGIASGKSTVAAAFRDLGIPVIDADAIAREVVEPGTDGLAAVVAEFGDGVLGADGALDRKALARIVFADPDARRRLEAITHPRIAALSAARIAEAHEAGPPYVVYEAALLVETGRHAAFPALVVVAVRPDTQLARLAARDGEGEAAARARIAAQLPLEQKLALADHVVWNDGSVEETRRRVAEIHAALTAQLGGTR